MADRSVGAWRWGWASVLMAGVVSLATACSGGQHRSSGPAAAEMAAPTAASAAAATPAPASRPAEVHSPDESGTKAPGTLTSASNASDEDARGTLRAAFKSADPAVIEMVGHIVTLANPFFEGRSADTAGNRTAAEYVRFNFEKLGLKPAFGGGTDRPGGDEAYAQAFDVPGEVRVHGATLAVFGPADERSELQVEKDFNPLGFSGKGKASGELVFVGYSITDGPDKYSSYKESDDLTGKIALMLRWEPVNPDGKSRWSSFSGWSRNAGLMDKVGAAVKRGAAAVVLVNPPGIDDDRAKTLETAKSTRFSSAIGVPVVMLSNEQAKKLVKLAAPEGEDLMSLRRKADNAGKEPTGAVPMSTGVRVEMNIDVDRAKLATRNVGAILPGRGALAEEYVIIGAHYDHVGYGYVGGAAPGNVGQLHPGADDNASGTAGLIVLARMLSERYAKLPERAEARSILFLAFSAEEMGLLGSEHFIEQAMIPASKVEAMLNMDMIGRMSSSNIEVDGVGTAEGFEEMLKPLFDSSGLKVTTGLSGQGPSDHASFYKAGIPVLHFFTGVHADYHKPSDLPWKVNYEGAVKVLGLIEKTAMLLAQRTERLAFKATAGPSLPGGSRSRASVRLGVMPADYSGREPGVLVGDVFPNTSADKGGIKKGDRLIRWGGEELADVAAMMGRLQSHKPGDVVEIVVVREGQEVTLQVTLLGREPQG